MWGHSLQSCNVAIIVPDEIEFRKKLKDQETSFEDLCSNKANVETLMTTVNEFARKEGLKGFELARAIHLEHDPFTVSYCIITYYYFVQTPRVLRHVHLGHVRGSCTGL